MPAASQPESQRFLTMTLGQEIFAIDIFVPAHTLWTFSMKCPLFSNGSRHGVCQAHYV